MPSDIRRDINDLEFWNTDQSVDPPTMLRGMMGRDSTGTWRYLTASASGYLMVSGTFAAPGTVTLSADASGNRVSAFSNDAGLMRVSAVGGSTVSLSADASGNRVSAVQADAGNLMVSGRSDDAAKFRVSAIGGTAGDNTLVDGITQTLSANLLRVSGVVSSGFNALVTYAQNRDDAANLRVSTFSGDAALMRVSSIGTGSFAPLSADSSNVSAVQGDAGKLLISAKSPDAGAFLVSAAQKGTWTLDSGSVSAKSSDAGTMLVSAIQGDAAKLRISAIGVSVTTSPLSADSSSISAKQDDAVNLNVSAKSNDGGKLRVSAFLATGTTGPIDNASNVMRFAVDDQGNTISNRGITFLMNSASTWDRQRSMSPSGIGLGVANVGSWDGALFHISAKSLDAGTLLVSAKQDDAALLRVSTRSDDAGLMRVSAVGGSTVSLSADASGNRVSAVQADASNLNVSSKSLDAGTLLVSAKQGDAGLLRVSAVGGTAGDNTLVDGTTQTLSANLLRVSGVVSSGFNGLVTYSQNRDDATNLRVSAFSNDGGLLRVSAIGSTASPLSADSSSVSAKQSDATNLRVSAIQSDAGLLHVSAIGVTTPDAVLVDGSIQTLSASLLRVSGVVSAGFNALVTYSQNRDDATNLRVSAFSKDGGTFLISASGGILSATLKEGTAFVGQVSANQAGTWAISALAKEGTSFIGNVSATLKAGTANIGYVSAFLDNGSVSAKSSDAATFRVSAINSISALSPDAALFRVSSQPIDRTTSAFMTAVGDSVSLSAFGGANIGAQLSGTWTGTVAFQGTIDESNWFPIFGVDNITNAIVSSTTTSRNVFFETAGLRRFRLSSTAAMTGTLSAFMNGTEVGGDEFVVIKQDDAGYSRISAVQEGAGALRISAFSLDGGTFLISASGGVLSATNKEGTAFIGNVSAKNTDAGTFLVSAKQGDAGLLLVSAAQKGTWTLDTGSVSAKSSDAGTMLVSAKQGDAGLLLISAKQGDAALFRISAIGADANTLHVSAVQGDAGLMRVSTIGATVSGTFTPVPLSADSSSISAKQDDAVNLNVSAKSKDGGTLRTSASIFPDTTGGLTIFTNYNVSSSINVKSTAGAIYGYYAWNNDAKPNWINFYNVSGAINVGTDAIKWQLYLPASAAANEVFPIGLAGFTTGISVASVSAAVSTATTPGAASAIGLNLYYK